MSSRRGPKCWIAALALFAIGAADVRAQQSAAGEKSWIDSLSSGVKQGFNKVGQTLSPKSSSKSSDSSSSPENDPVSLKNGGKPGPALYVAVGRLYVESNKPSEAEEQYKAALKLQPNYLPALLGYAQLKEQTGQPDVALQIYQTAIRAHPKEAAIYNNVGLCYARQHRGEEAIAAMSRAVKLAPRNPLYRNNVATVLVDRGRLSEAFIQLKELQGEAVAYYNVGYLLANKGHKQEAVRNFNLALQADPSLTAAQRWLARLGQSEEPMPRRLPPIPSNRPEFDSPARPQISASGQPGVPTAPMPPSTPSGNSALRPLPRVN